MTAFFNHLRCQGNISGNDKITGIKPFDYLVVSDIKTRCHPDEINAA